MDVGEHLEFVGAAYVISVAGHPIGDHPLAFFTAHLALDKRLDHALLLGHATYPTVRFDAHGFILIQAKLKAWILALHGYESLLVGERRSSPPSRHQSSLMLISGMAFWPAR